MGSCPCLCKFGGSLTTAKAGSCRRLQRENPCLVSSWSVGARSGGREHIAFTSGIPGMFKKTARLRRGQSEAICKYPCRFKDFLRNTKCKIESRAVPRHRRFDVGSAKPASGCAMPMPPFAWPWPVGAHCYRNCTGTPGLCVPGTSETLVLGTCPRCSSVRLAFRAVSRVEIPPVWVTRCWCPQTRARYCSALPCNSGTWGDYTSISSVFGNEAGRRRF